MSIKFYLNKSFFSRYINIINNNIYIFVIKTNIIKPTLELIFKYKRY